MSRRHAPLLPELLDMVFDNLHPTDLDWPESWPKAEVVRQPLSACTLVSRSWYPVAREHLFRDLVYSFVSAKPLADSATAVPNDSAKPRWLEASDYPAYQTLCNVERIPWKTLPMFLDFLQQSPAVRSSIRKLRLAHYPTKSQDGTNWPNTAENRGPPKEDTIDGSLLARLMSLLPRLVDLLAHDIFVTSPRSLDSPIPPLSVHTLHLKYDLYSGKVEEACKLLSHFSKVEHLVFITSWPDIPGELSADFPSSTSLDVRSLTLHESRRTSDGTPFGTLSQVILRSPSAYRLRSLSLTVGLSNPMIQKLNGLITGLGSSLERLYLMAVDFLVPEPATEAGPSLDLSKATKLRELVIGTYFIFNYPSSYNQWIADFLRFFCQTAPSREATPSLRKIGFIFGTFGDPSAHGSRWWEDLSVRPAIDTFEAHFSRLIHALKLEGMIFECRDAQYDLFSDPLDASRLQALRDLVPVVFPRLAQEGLIIYEDDTPVAAQ